MFNSIFFSSIFSEETHQQLSLIENQQITLNWADKVGFSGEWDKKKKFSKTKIFVNHSCHSTNGGSIKISLQPFNPIKACKGGSEFMYCLGGGVPRDAPLCFSSIFQGQLIEINRPQTLIV